jgi:hypothetical protein
MSQAYVLGVSLVVVMGLLVIGRWIFRYGELWWVWPQLVERGELFRAVQRWESGKSEEAANRLRRREEL